MGTPTALVILDGIELVDGSVTVGDAEELSGGVAGGQVFLGDDDGTLGYVAFGDAYAMYRSSRGGADTFYGGDNMGNDSLIGGGFFILDIGAADFSSSFTGAVVFAGDAEVMFGDARGGNDTLYGGIGSSNLFVGDALSSMSGDARGGNDVLMGGDAYGGEGDGYSTNIMVGDAYAFGGGRGPRGVDAAAFIGDADGVVGGKDVLVGGDAYALSGTAVNLNVAIGDAVVMSGGFAASDAIEGGDAAALGGTAGVFNVLVGDAGIMAGLAIGAGDRISGGDAYAVAGGDAYALNLMAGDAYSLYDGATGGRDIMTGGNASADGDGYAAAINLMAGDAFSYSGDVIFGSDIMTGGDGSLDGDGYVVNAMYGDLGDYSFGVPGFTALPDEFQSLAGDFNAADALGALGGVAPLERSEAALYGSDQLFGGAEQAENFMVGDAPVLYSGDVGGQDRLVGGGASTINALIGDAISIAEGAFAGKDVLVSGAGEDDMWGDAMEEMAGFGAADRFVFGPDNGNDTVHDFRLADRDRIDLKAFGHTGDFRNFRAFMESGRAENVEDGVVLYLDVDEGQQTAQGRGDTVLLVGLTVEDLTASMFIF